MQLSLDIIKLSKGMMTSTVIDKCSSSSVMNRSQACANLWMMCVCRFRAMPCQTHSTQLSSLLSTTSLSSNTRAPPTPLLPHPQPPAMRPPLLSPCRMDSVATQGGGTSLLSPTPLKVPPAPCKETWQRVVLLRRHFPPPLHPPHFAAPSNRHHFSMTAVAAWGLVEACRLKYRHPFHTISSTSRCQLLVRMGLGTSLGWTAAAPVTNSPPWMTWSARLWMRNPISFPSTPLATSALPAPPPQLMTATLRPRLTSSPLMSKFASVLGGLYTSTPVRVFCFRWNVFYIRLEHYSSLAYFLCCFGKLVPDSSDIFISFRT